MYLPGFGPEQSLEWPQVELTETEREWKLTAELPGLESTDVEVLVTSRQITLRGEGRLPRDPPARGVPAQRFYGRFERRIALPTPVNESSAAASFSEGTLTVVLTKLLTALKRIEIE